MKLSVCIPTYNRAPLLRENLDRLLLQIEDGMEIVISDNGSTDGTESLIAEYRERYPFITYHRWQSNMGADRNYLKTVELASGEYCWLFGSDDTVCPGAVHSVLKMLENGSDIHVFNCCQCTYRMTPLRKLYWMSRDVGDTVFFCAEQRDLERYFGSAILTGALFGFLTSIVVKRSAWQMIPFNESFIGTAYSHAFILLSLLRGGCTLHYDPRHLVYHRMDNDSFFADGSARRILLDLNGFGAIRDQVFDGIPAVQSAINEILHREYKWWYLSRRRLDMTRKEWSSVRSAFREIGYPERELRLADALGSCEHAVRLLLWIKRHLVHWFWAQKELRTSQ